MDEYMKLRTVTYGLTFDPIYIELLLVQNTYTFDKLAHVGVNRLNTIKNHIIVGTGIWVKSLYI